MKFASIIASLSAVTSGMAKAEIISPEVTITAGASGTFQGDWEGRSGHTYFVKCSTNLVDWSYAPLIFEGEGSKSFGFCASTGPCFIRLKLTDIVTSNAELDDFDRDGIPNLGEVAYLGTDPFLADSDGDGVIDYDEDVDSDGIPDGWEAHALVKLPTSYNFISIAQITQGNIEMVANDAQLPLPPGILANQVSIEIVVKSTQALTLRPENAWPVLPTDQTFSKTFVGPDTLTSSFPDWHFDAGNALVLVKNSNSTLLVSASTKSGNPAKLKVVRDPADLSAVGTGPLTLLPVHTTDFATVSLDGRGSFYVVGWVDANDDNLIDSTESRYVVPIISVDVNVAGVEYVKGQSFFTASPPAGFDPSYLIVQFGKNEHDYMNDLPPGAPVPDPIKVADMYGKAGISMRGFADLIGGKDGMRGTDRVMGGWSNNIVAFTTTGRFVKEGVAEPEWMKIGLASNLVDATGWDSVAEVFQFEPVDPAPLVYEEPVLDRFTLNNAINGLNAICLITNSFQRLGSPLLGQRVEMTAWDTPRDALPQVHPNHPECFLMGFQSATAFAAYLSFWSSPEPFDDYIEAAQLFSKGLAGERAYQDAYKIEWSTAGFSEISSVGMASRGAQIFVDESEMEEYSPVKEPNTVNHETRPPVSGTTIHYDAH